MATEALRDAMEEKMPKRAKVGRTRVTVFADGGKCLGSVAPTRLAETAAAMEAASA